MSNIVLCNLSDANKTIDEERLNWARDVLRALGVSEEIINTSDIRNFRFKMEEYGIEVELFSNGNVDIYKKQWYSGPSEELSGWLPVNKDHLVAQWKEPTYIKKIENKDVYYEIHLEEWSILNSRK